MAAATAAAFGVARVDAANFTWNNAAGGFFGLGSNWTPVGTPAAADAALFQLPNTYTVTFFAPATNTQFSVTDGTVTLNLDGQAYTLTNAFVGQSLVTTPTSPRLTVTNGTLSSNVLSLAPSSGGTGVLVLGTNARYIGTAVSIIGGQGSGTLLVQSGGSFNSTSYLDVADATASFGAVSISDPGSTVSCGTIIVGQFGNGNLSIANGGVLNCASAAYVPLANVASSTAQATVSGPGSAWNLAGQLEVGNTGAASLTIANGGRVTSTGNFSSIVGAGTFASGTVSVTGAGSIWDSGTVGLTIGSLGRAEVDVTAGGVVNSGQTLLASGGSTSLGVGNVSGAGSTWNCASINLGLNGAAIFNVVNGGQLNVGSNLTVNAPASAAAAVLTLNGGTIVCGSFTRLGTFSFNDGTLIVTSGVYQNSAAVAPLAIDGNSVSANPTLVLKGASSMTNVSTLTVGQNRNGTVVLSDRATVNLTAGVSIAAAAGSNGTLIVGGGDANAGATASVTATGTVSVGGNGFSLGGNGTLIINAGGSVVANGGMLFGPDGYVRLNGGSLTVGTTALSAYVGSRFQFDAGQLFFNFDFVNTSQFWNDYFFGPTDTLRAGMVLSPGQNNTFGIGAPLTIDGGLIGNNFLSTGSLSNSSVLTIKSGGVNVGGRVTNTAGGLISLSGNSSIVTPVGGFVNNGNVQMASPQSQIVAPFTNNGTLRGTGNVAGAFTNNAAGQVVIGSGERLVFLGGAFTNSGLVSATHGEAQFDGTVTNNATGSIAGHDNTLRFNAGLNNAGSLLFTSGQSDVFGDIVNNSGGKVIVSGGGTTTFYDTITNNTGAELRVSIGGTGVFFGAVNGPGAISGSGLKIFEGGQSSVAALATGSGSSIVEADASLIADNIQESSLTLSGAFTVRANGTSAATSRLNHLNVDGGTNSWLGKFDLNDNALVIDYAATDPSPLSDIRNQIKSGYSSGSWTGNGITSSTAAAAATSSHRTAIGYAEASSLGAGSFAGQTVDGTAVLTRYTLAGDSNLDRKVDLTDFTFLAANFNGTNRTWLQGDYNYDGTVDLTDFTLLASNFNQFLASDAASLGATVPEPCGAALCGAALVTVLGRRRRRTTAAC
jgi:fibronectin-binding autotransporter adhesin